MANQIVVSAGAKVRNLNGVLTGTTGVVNSLPINAANGIPQLDVNGKILVSQLPNSVMEYQGTWNAATNTPTLVNGTGNQGDVYLCNVAGTVNFGAGPIAFVVGDQVIYSGTIWQRASGATGTVTSVAITESGDSLNITGSPISTSGTINIGFNGTNLQYVNGAGNLTTFPTLITSIGLSMPSAFSVANSPLTANGTIAVTGAGVASQYIRGDGTLADFPSSGGGGSSVSYYLNGGTSQGTIGGVTYYEMSKTADTGTGVDFTKSGDGFIVAFLTDANDPAQLNIPAGNWNYEIYASMSANGGTPQMYAELYKYDGTTFTLISTSTNEILYDGVNLNLYTFAMTVPATTLALTDRLAIKLYATNSGGKTTTIHTQDSHLCQVITTFSTGITALNGLTAQVQYFQVGTSGTDFNISSTTATHTFNIPSASATNRGLITTGTQTIAGIKTFTAGNTNFVEGVFTGVSGTTAGALHLYQSSSPSFFGGPNYTDIWADTTNINFNIRYSSAALLKQPVLNFGSLTDNTTRTYTFPDLTGTIAMLEGTQTFTGSKTFSANPSINTGGQSSLSILSSTGNSAVIFGYVNNILKGTIDISATEFKFASAINSTFKFQASGLGIASLIFDNTTNYSYTFPATSGTIALTSNLSSYVPYTGATTNVDLGLYSLTSNSIKVIGDNSTYGGTLSIKQSNVTSLIGVGYTELFGKTNRLGISFGAGSIAYLSNSTLTAERTYTLPDATGTIALVGGSGVGTVTSVAALTIGTSGTDLSSTVANSTTTPVITLNVPTASATNRGALASADWTTFNSKQGTITLTTTGTSGAATFTSNTLNIPNYGSALSGYLPLTGGTLTGPLSGTSATFSGNLAIGGQSNIYGGLAGLYALQNGNSSYYSYDQESGIVGNGYYDGGWKYKTTNLASRYIANVGTHTFQYASSGTAGAALTWNNAMYIGNTGNVGIGTVSPDTWATKLVIYNNQLTVTGGGYDGTFADSIFFGGNSEGTNYRNKISNSLSATAANQKMKFSVASGATTWVDALTLTGTGAATFSSSVTAQTGEFISGGQDGATGSVVRISSTNALARNWGIVNTWDNYGDLTFRVSNAAGGNALSAGSTKMVILSSGNVGIGTSSPSAVDITLNVKGLSGVTNASIVAESYDATKFVMLYSGVGGSDMPSIIYAGDLRFGNGTKSTSSYNERMRITSAGKVLIGTSTSGGSILRISGVPNGSVGLSVGDVYEVDGFLCIKT